MADYTLSATITADASGFTDGVERASGALDSFKQRCRQATSSATSDVSGMSSETSSAWDRIRSKASSAWDGVRSAVSSRISNAWNSVRTNAGQMVSALGSVGKAGVAAVAGIAVQGGFDRALAIDNARKKLAGLGHDAADIASIMDSATTAVRGTAYGLGDAATAAATLSAAGIKSGQDMTDSLQAVANVAAASGRSFDDIGTIFSSVAARGKLMGDDMLQLTSSGVPVLQLLGSYLGKTSQEVSDMVSKGQIDFQTFSDAMREGFGDSAKASGDMFQGAAANVRAALSRMVEPLATPVIQGAIDIFKRLSTAIDGLPSALAPVMPALAPIAAGFAALAAGGLAPVISSIPGLGSLLGPLSDGLSALGGPVGVAMAAFLGIVAVCPPLQDALGNLFGSIGQLAQAFVSFAQPLVDAVMPVLSQFVQWVGQGLADAINAGAQAIQGFAGYLQGIADGGTNALTMLQPVADWFMGTLVPALQGIGDYIAQTFGPAWDVLVQGFQDFVANVGPLLTPALQAAQVAFQQIGDAIGTYLVPMFQTLQPVFEAIAMVLASVVGPALTMVAGIVSSVFTAAFTVAGAVISGAMQVISGVVQAVVGTIEAIVGVFVGVFTGDWSMAANGAKSVMSGLANVLGGIMNGISGTIGGILRGIAGTFTSVFNGISGTASGVFSAIASTISGKISEAKNVVSNGLDAISGFFKGLHLEFPKIKLPHFSISGSFSLDPPSIPTISVSWYAKGGILTRPTIFGASGGSVLGGGEAGPEAVLPISRLVGFMSDALSDYFGDRGGTGGTTVNQHVVIVREDEDLYSAATILNRSALAEL